MAVLLLTLLGLCFGSFVNALVWRIKHKRGWVRERSECTHCHHILAPKDLVPVLSWLWLGGRCRYCKKPIADSPIVELLLPALFVLSYICWPQPLSGVGLFDFGLWLIFLVGFMALAVYDLKWFLLPDKFIFPLIGLSAFQVVSRWLVFNGSWHSVVSSLLGVVAISGLFYLIFSISDGKWIGFGDVKLGIILGLLAGGIIPALMVLFVASLLGTVVSIPMLLAGQANRKSHLPFGPLLLAGLVVVVLFGQSITDWYARLIY
jgi:leader peptidase (prepilin peptidase)/N-methyltransferase